MLALLMLTGPVATFAAGGVEYVLNQSGLFDSEGSRLEVATWPLALFFVLVALLAFLNIFFYKNRIRQMRICIFLIFLFAGMVGMIFYYLAVARNLLDGAQTLHNWRIVIPPISIIMTYLAFRRIRRDELLVKAFDRIR